MIVSISARVISAEENFGLERSTWFIMSCAYADGSHVVAARNIHVPKLRTAAVLHSINFNFNR